VSNLLRQRNAATSLNLRFCLKMTSGALNAVASLKELTDLNLEGCGKMLDDRALSYLRPCVKLRRLVVDGCSRLSAAGIKPLIQGCKDIRELSLNGVTAVNDQLLALLADAPNLSSLKLNSASSITDLGLLLLSSRLGPRLTELHLAYCAALTDKGIEDLAKHCPNLTNLNLYGINNVTDRSLAALRHCGKLEVLDLSMCRRVTDQGMLALLKGGSKLRSLNLYDCVLLTAHSLNTLADLCPDLRYLGAYGLDELTKAAALSFLSKAKRIERMDLGGCMKLSPADIDALAKQFRRISF